MAVLFSRTQKKATTKEVMFNSKAKWQTPYKLHDMHMHMCMHMSCACCKGFAT